MSAMAYKGCKDTGHGCFPPRASTEGSSTVFVNGIPIHCVGDKWAVHTCGDNAHDGELSSGSSSVYIEGDATGRIGDNVSCGSVVAEGSSDVFAG